MPRLKRTRETARLSLDVSLTVRERIERLRESSDADSVTEVVRRALAVYEVLIAERKRGSEMILRDAGGVERRLLLP